MIPSQPTAKMSTLCPPENFAPALDQFSLTPPPDWAFFNWTGNASTAQLSVLYPLQANLSLGLYMRAGTGVSYCGNTGRSTGPFSYEAGRLVLTNSLGATIWEDSVNVSGTVTLATCTLPSSLDIDFGNMYTASSGSTIGTATTTFVMQCANIIESLPDVTIDAISKTGDMVTEPERSDYGISLTYDNAPVTLGSPVSRGSTGSHTISARLLQLESKVKAGEINANATITLSYN
jgi:type 1 fimbria pilin